MSRRCHLKPARRYLSAAEKRVEAPVRRHALPYGSDSYCFGLAGLFAPRTLPADDTAGSGLTSTAAQPPRWPTATALQPLRNQMAIRQSSALLSQLRPGDGFGVAAIVIGIGPTQGRPVMANRRWQAGAGEGSQNRNRCRNPFHEMLPPRNR